MTFKLGLTGGIGSGKSTVAAMLARHGAHIADADAISRQVSSPGGAAIAPIERAFGASLIAPDGSLDRDAMRALIYTQPDAKARLEAIIHPLVRQGIAQQVQAAIDAKHRLIVLDIPLLVESATWRPQLDAILVVDCSPDTQIHRVMQRSGLQRAQVQAIIDAQAPRALRLAAADVVLCNDGIDIPTLTQQVQQIALRFGL